MLKKRWVLAPFAIPKKIGPHAVSVALKRTIRYHGTMPPNSYTALLPAIHYFGAHFYSIPGGCPTKKAVPLKIKYNHWLKSVHLVLEVIEGPFSTWVRLKHSPGRIGREKCQLCLRYSITWSRLWHRYLKFHAFVIQLIFGFSSSSEVWFKYVVCLH